MEERNREKFTPADSESLLTVIAFFRTLSILNPLSGLRLNLNGVDSFLSPSPKSLALAQHS
jgi:hypothetical protein